MNCTRPCLLLYSPLLERAAEGFVCRALQHHTEKERERERERENDTRCNELAATKQKCALLVILKHFGGGGGTGLKFGGGGGTMLWGMGGGGRLAGIAGGLGGIPGPPAEPGIRIPPFLGSTLKLNCRKNCLNLPSVLSTSRLGTLKPMVSYGSAANNKYCHFLSGGSTRCSYADMNRCLGLRLCRRVFGFFSSSSSKIGLMFLTLGMCKITALIIVQNRWSPRQVVEDVRDGLCWFLTMMRRLLHRCYTDEVLLVSVREQHLRMEITDQLVVANESLKRFFGKCRDGKVRVFKIAIENEELTLANYKDTKGSWEQDYDKMVLPLLEDEQPAYILYRLDTKANGKYEWLLVSWSPEGSPVRQKMLYASTKATLKQEFGGGQIKEELFGTSLDDVSLHGFLHHRLTAKTPAPLTTAEEELQELKRSEGATTVGVDHRHQTMQGVAFPVSAGARRALTHLADGRCNYVRLRIDVQHEEIHLDDSSTLSVSQLPSQVPSDAARYHVFTFKHTHEGDYLESFPSRNACSTPLEIDSGDELTEAFLQDELHPKKNLHRPQFAKPKGPPNRGAKRLTRPQQVEN
ncbi:hypothetical protein B566_EDAN004636 [Ephemera danica]|nr:hypothetical protein B566_EDAN004636 [Ephemera danica]